MLTRFVWCLRASVGVSDRSCVCTHLQVPGFVRDVWWNAKHIFRIYLILLVIKRTATYISKNILVSLVDLSLSGCVWASPFGMRPPPWSLASRDASTRVLWYFSRISICEYLGNLLLLLEGQWVHARGESSHDSPWGRTRAASWRKQVLSARDKTRSWRWSEGSRMWLKANRGCYRDGHEWPLPLFIFFGGKREEKKNVPPGARRARLSPSAGTARDSLRGSSDWGPT